MCTINLIQKDEHDLFILDIPVPLPPSIVVNVPGDKRMIMGAHYCP